MPGCTIRNFGMPGDHRRGLSADFLRSRMAQRLAARGIPDDICAVLERVPRHAFAASGWDLEQAYADSALPIGHGQTISQPYVVARMTALLRDGCARTGSVLEVGTGCGYQTVVLAGIFERVYSVERIAALATTARERLRDMGALRVHTRHGDGFDGWEQQAPFDGILVTAAAEQVPPALIAQLRVGGRLVMPVGPPGQQVLMTVDRHDDSTLRVGRFDPVTFVPLLPDRIG